MKEELLSEIIKCLLKVLKAVACQKERLTIHRLLKNLLSLAWVHHHKHPSSIREAVIIRRQLKKGTLKQYITCLCQNKKLWMDLAIIHSLMDGLIRHRKSNNLMSLIHRQLSAILTVTQKMARLQPQGK